MQPQVHSQQPDVGSTKKRRDDLIFQIGSRLGELHFPTGDRAALRRYEPRHNTRGETVALRLLIEAGGEEEWASKDIKIAVERWAWLLHCMALMSGPDRKPHDRGKDPGAVLHTIGYSEARLGRLLDARGDTFDDLLARTCRMVAARGETIDWTRVAPLVLAENGDVAERARLRIAASYYKAQADAKKD